MNVKQPGIAAHFYFRLNSVAIARMDCDLTLVIVSSYIYIFKACL